ncbi:unnamed protein product, partial [Laminaria digitata]
ISAASAVPDWPQPLRAILSGTAGTGKTVVINEIVRLLGNRRILLMAPTGNVAVAIGGRTIHTALKIGVQTNRRRPADPSALSLASLAALQTSMTAVDYILVDEMSMIGQGLLGLMSIRGKQAMQGCRASEGGPERRQDLFGGLSILLVGDPMQLPPVGASPMWSSNPGNAGHTVEGLRAWSGLNAGVELTEVRRQTGPEQAAFRQALLGVAQGVAIETHWNLLGTRMRSNVPLQHARSFEDAVHIFPTNALADTWNWERLQLLGTTIARINAYHNIRGDESAPADRFRGLHPHLFLAVGARVFVNNNVWTGAGIANGAVGQVVHMQWGGDRRPPLLPDVVFVRMENYRGPQYFEEPLQRGELNLRNVIPIAPTDATDDDPPARGRRRGNPPEGGSARCIRTQLPLMLAFAVTIHKSQGCSLDRVVVDIGRNERTDGQTFTALSRCREICGMLLETFDVERLVRIGSSNSFPARLRAMDAITRLEDRT